MSMTRKEFLNGTGTPKEDIKNHAVYEFMRRCSGRAWRVVEIAKGTKYSENSVRRILKAMAKKKVLVSKKNHYLYTGR